MKGRFRTEQRRAFLAEHGFDRSLPAKELLGGFASSASLDETASNSSLASSSFSLSSGLSSVCLDIENPPKVSFELPSTNEELSSSAVPPKTSSLSNKQHTTIHTTNNLGIVQPLRRLPSQTLLGILSLNRDQVVWEEMEDDLCILLDGNLDRLLICKEFYFQRKDGRIQSCELLKSLGYLVSSRPRDMSIYDDHVSRIACFLSTAKHPRHLKLDIVKALMCLVSTQKYLHADDKSNHPMGTTVERMFVFLTSRSHEWDDDLAEVMPSMAVPIVYEIRARCLRYLDLEQERIQTVVDTGDNTAVLIATGAKIVELGIYKSNEAIEGKINTAGKTMKGWIDEANSNNMEPPEHKTTTWKEKIAKEQDAAAVRALSGSTKRASEYARQSSNRVAQSTIETTLSGLHTIGNKLERNTKISPQNREIMRAVGKVGIASVGAVAIVAEAILASSRNVSSKTVGVTVDIVGQTCGSVAGEVAKDAADTYENVLRTMSNLSLVTSGKKLARSAAKNAGKTKIDEDAEKAKEILLKLEKQGAAVAKHTLGIQWAEGSLTKGLISGPRAALEDSPKSGSKESCPPKAVNVENDAISSLQINDVD